ncbi:nucleoside hydrolase [Arthrobacter sp. AZCC_0090]|uniref:nucleoside hydrolase n=1 Tax=Arthrobacter sp. AZCC_0090 TaxID=2735881 RepID=UPI00160CA235|nr:nucleoside hydrolase [Arthrobacter sp. AZCC_0090]MBB6403245.1 purine nucleosidase [Arthrobacter sp. AZCC_0090]
MTTTTPQPFYLDCDTGIDDSLAIAYLLASPEVELAGIGTVSGNVSAAVGASNTLNLLHAAGRTGIPVAVGAHDPLTGTFDGGAPHVHGHNGIGGITLGESGVETESETAAEMLVRLAHEYPGELRVIAVGPLTNLALALELDPKLPALVRDVTIMGGAAFVRGNISPAAEANIFNDAEAAAAVMDAAWPVTLVPLDVTMNHRFDETHRAALAASAHPVASALSGMLDQYFAFYNTIFGERCAALHDPLAAAIAVGALELDDAPHVGITVDTSVGAGRGKTHCERFDGGAANGWEVPERASRVVLSVKGDAAAHLLERILSLPTAG